MSCSGDYIRWFADPAALGYDQPLSLCLSSTVLCVGMYRSVLLFDYATSAPLGTVCASYGTGPGQVFACQGVAFGPTLSG